MKMRKMGLKPMVFAVAAALSPMVAQAAVTANQLPGDGTVLYGSAAATVNGSSMAVNITGTDQGMATITWGNTGGTLNAGAATGGFNIGSQANVTFDNGTGNNVAPFVLNVDTTSNPTEIAGSLVGNGVNIGIANGNGIMVDGSAVINAPDGLALMNQAYTSGDLSAMPASPGIIFDFQGATGGVTIATGASISLGSYVFIVGAGNVNVDAPLVDSGAGTNILSIYGASGSSININAPVVENDIATNDALVIGNDGGTTNLNIGTTGSIQGGYVMIGRSINPAGGSVVGDYASLSVINILDNGSIIATNAGNAGEVQLGFLNEVNGSSITQPGSTGLPAGTVVEAIGSVSGSGYIQGNIVAFLNQVGPVNNNTTGQILANGFQIQAGNSGTANVYLVPGWSSASGFNVQIAGNGSINTAYQAPSYSGSSTVSMNPQADDASRLIVQATGTLTAGNAGDSSVSTITIPGTSTSTPAIVFPGLVYLLGNQGLTVNNPIDTAYSTSTPQGYGVFLLGPTVTDGNAIIANGDRGINIESTSYGPTTINGTNVTQGQPALPSFYFLQSSNGALNLAAQATFNNEWNWSNPGQVFFVSPQYTGNSYPQT